MRTRVLTLALLAALTVGIVAQTPVPDETLKSSPSSWISAYTADAYKYHYLTWIKGERLIIELEAPVSHEPTDWSEPPTNITIGNAVANVTPLCVQSVWDETTHCTDVGTVRRTLFTQTTMGAAAPVKLTAAQITATLIAQMESLCRQNGVSQIDVLPLIRLTTPLAVK